jgi:hypothetical protein
VTAQRWLVHRDGDLWTLQAESVVQAIEDSVWRQDTFNGRPCGEPRLSRGVAVLPHVRPPDLEGVKPIAVCVVTSVFGQGEVSDGRAIYLLNEGSHPVVVLGAVVRAHSKAIAIYKRAAAWLDKLQRIEREDAARLPKPLPVYKSGKRKGEIHWPAKMGADQRAAYSAAFDRNAYLRRETEVAATLCDWSKRWMEHLAPARKPLEECTEQELLERLTERKAEIADAGKPTPPELLMQVAAIQERLDVFDSIRSYGFDVGTIVDVLPASWSDDQSTHRGRVTEARVEHKPTYFGKEPATQHRRVVEFFDGTETSQPEVDRLRLVTST